jgi:hypothetical protein
MSNGHPARAARRFANIRDIAGSKASTIGMTNCYFCEGDLPTGATICHHCGRPQPTLREVRRKWIGVAIVVISAIAIMLIWDRVVGFQIGSSGPQQSLP